MKRHPALVALSSDHHHSLVHARRLLVAAAGTTSGSTSAPERQVAGQDMQLAAAGFLTFWKEEISRHFREEEEALLPAFARYGDPSEAR